MRNTYTSEYRLKAVAMYNEGFTVACIARQLNISTRSVGKWKDMYLKRNLAEKHLIPKTRNDIDYKRLYEKFTALKEELKDIKLECEILKKGNSFLFLKPREKYPFILQNIGVFSIKKMCEMLKIGTVGYHRWLDRPPTWQSEYYEMLLEEVKRVYEEHKGRYGSRRITIELKLAGFKTNQVSVCNMMRKMNLKVVGSKLYKITTNSVHRFPFADNKLVRKFNVIAPNKVWVSDITYIKMSHANYWLYLTVIIDLFDRKVVGWALSETLKTKDTTVEAFRMALINRPVQEHHSLIFHSDRGVQYASNEFTSEMKKYESITQSMNRKNTFWDNAVAESFFSRLKIELIYPNKYETKEQASASIFEYIENYYNINRRHSALNYLTMTEFQKLIDESSKNNPV